MGDGPDSSAAPKAEGNERHPRHGEWLTALGRATYAAARVATICFDLLRVFGEHGSATMYNDPLGRLEHKLRALQKAAPERLPGLGDFIETLTAARESRNDLLHALATEDGLLRRRSDDLDYVRDFSTIESLDEVHAHLTAALIAGNALLYHDGGAAVVAWVSAGGN